MDPISTAAGIAQILQLAMSTEQPSGRRRSSRREREAAYLEFQRTALDVLFYTGYLQVLAESEPSSWRRPLLGAGLIGDVLLERVQGADAYEPTLRRFAKIARLGVVGDLTMEAVRHNVALHQIAAAMSAHSTFSGALARVRLVGAPAVRRGAENLTSLLAELNGTIPSTRPDRVMRYMPWAKAQEAAWQSRSEYFNDCLRAIGEAQKEFTLAARADLGRGHRWWHRGSAERTRWWQFWRSRPNAT